MAAKVATTRNPLVSVIVPVYNIESYIADAVQSVIDQTMDDWELILIDDGSHDGSLSACQELASDDERIFVVAQEHAGPGAARNHGISLARGAYVFFLDGDDMIEPHALERCVRAAKEADADMVQFGGKTLVQDGLRHDERFYIRSKEYPGVWNGAELYLAQCEARDYHVAPFLYLSRKELFANWGDGSSGDAGVFPPDIIHEDQAAMYRLLTSANRVVCLPDLLAVRRYRTRSIMTGRDWRASTRGYFRVYALAYSEMSGRDPAQGLRTRADRHHLNLIATYCIVSFYRTNAPVSEFAAVCDACAEDEAALKSLLARKELDPRLFRVLRWTTLARWRLGATKRRLTTMLRTGARLRGTTAL